MALQNKVAYRYAKAVFAHLEGASGPVREMMESLDRFAQLAVSHEELSRVLYSAVYSDSQREPVVEDLVKKMKLGESTRRVLLVLSRAGRLSHLPLVVKELRHLLLQSEGIVPLHVESATVLSAEERKSVEREFAERMGKKVDASYAVDPKVLGGLKVTAGGRTFEGTLQGWLETFEQRLVGG